jgi:2,5-furandicarboxylate decarboxylase 1
VEWAVATRFQGDRDLLIISQIQISSLDPSSAAGMGTKMGIDATVPWGGLQEGFKPIAIPGLENIDPKDYY